MNNIQIFLAVNFAIAFICFTGQLRHFIRNKNKILLADLVGWFIVFSIPVINWVALWLVAKDVLETIVVWEPKQEPQTPVHVHAPGMMEYAYDAYKSNIPWQRWETDSGTNGQTWTHCVTHPSWHPDVNFRRKQK